MNAAKIAAPAVALALACGTLAHAEQPTSPATVGFVALNVADLDKSVAFYKAVGFTMTTQVGEKPKRTAVFQMAWPTNATGGLLLIEHDGAVAQGSAFNRVGVITNDAAALCKRLADAGTPCEREPKLMPQDQNAIVGFAKDPDGNRLELVQLPKAAQ